MARVAPTENEPQEIKVGSHRLARDYVNRIHELLAERTSSTDPLEVRTVLPHEVIEISRYQVKARDEGGDAPSAIKKAIEEKKRLLGFLDISDPKVNVVAALVGQAEQELGEKHRAQYENEISILELAKKPTPYERLGIDTEVKAGLTVTPENVQDSIRRIQSTIDNIPDERKSAYAPLIARLQEAFNAFLGPDGHVDPAKKDLQDRSWEEQLRQVRAEDKSQLDAYEKARNDLEQPARLALSIMSTSETVQKYLDLNPVEFFADPSRVGIIEKGLQRPLAYYKAFGVPYDASQAQIDARWEELKQIFSNLDDSVKQLGEVRNIQKFLSILHKKLGDPESRAQYHEEQLRQTQDAVASALGNPNVPFGLYGILGYKVPDASNEEELAMFKYNIPGPNQVKKDADTALSYIQSDLARSIFSPEQIRKAEDAIVNASSILTSDKSRADYDAKMQVGLQRGSDSEKTPGSRFITGLFNRLNQSSFVKNWLAPLLNDPKSLVYLGYTRSGIYGAIGLLASGAGLYYLAGAGALIIGGGLAAGWGFPLLMGAALIWVPGIGFIQSASVAASKTVTQYARLFRNKYEDRISALVAMPVDPEKNMPYIRGFLDDLIEDGGYSLEQKSALREKLERLRRLYDNSADGQEQGRFTNTDEGNRILKEIETWLFENPLFSSFNYRNIYMGRDKKVVAKEMEVLEKIELAREKEDAAFNEMAKAKKITEVYQKMSADEKAKLPVDVREKNEEALKDYFEKVRIYGEINGEISTLSAELRKQGAIFQNIAEVYRMAIATEEKLLKWRQFMRGGEIASYPELQTAFKTIAGDYSELLRYISEKKIAGPDGKERRLGSLSEQLSHINAPLISMFGNAAPTLVQLPSYLKVPA